MGIYPVPGTGWVVLIQQSSSDRHQLVALTTAHEGAPIETLDCSTDDVPHEPTEWALDSGRAAWMIAHALGHAATGTAPNECSQAED